MQSIQHNLTLWNRYLDQTRLSFSEMEKNLKASQALQAAEAEIARLRVDAEGREATLTTARLGRAAAEDALHGEQEARQRERELRQKLDEERAAERIAERERQMKEVEDADASGYNAAHAEAEAIYRAQVTSALRRGYLQGLDAANVSPDSMLRASGPTPMTAPRMVIPPVTSSQVENPDPLNFAFPARTDEASADGRTPAMGGRGQSDGDVPLTPSTQHPDDPGKLPDH